MMHRYDLERERTLYLLLLVVCLIAFGYENSTMKTTRTQFVVFLATLIAILTGLFAPAKAQSAQPTKTNADISRAVNDRILRGTPTKDGKVDLRVGEAATRDEVLAFNQRSEDKLQGEINVLTGIVITVLLLAILACLLPVINARHSVSNSEPSSEPEPDTATSDVATDVDQAPAQGIASNSTVPTAQTVAEPRDEPDLPNQVKVLTETDVQRIVEAVIGTLGGVRGHSPIGLPAGVPIIIENHISIDGTGLSMHSSQGGGRRRNRRRRGQQTGSNNHNNGRANEPTRS